ncbi:MAG: hypothetical protein HY825_14860 [Acidobacteria bacterium]|nr:hypothetical protein [Acidobacteriota bacterium]
MDNKVVAHFRDGRVVKGATMNFSTTRDRFHLTTPDGKTAEVLLGALKAVYFVKSFAGNKAYHEKKGFGDGQVLGRKIRCEFADGEVVTGTTQTYDATRVGFFVVPADPNANNVRVFVLNAATTHVTFES